jgi:hypothetical protein
VTGITPNSLSSASQKESLDQLAELAGMRDCPLDKLLEDGAAELRRQMKVAVESGEVTPGKMKALSQFLDDFERVGKQRSTTPEGMTVRTQELHDLLERFKHLQTEQKSKRKRL